MDQDKAVEVKEHIKKHYSEVKSWREGFKSKKNDSFMSRFINYLKRKELSIVVNMLGNQDGKRIIDAACGNGEFSLALARKYPHSTIYALDFSPSMCELTKNRTLEANISNIEVVEGDLENLPFENGFFDTVLCIDTLHHIPNSTIGKSLTELSRVAAMKGSIFVDFKNTRNPYVSYSHKKKNRETYYRTNRKISEIKKFLSESGLKVSKVKGVGFHSSFAPYVVVEAKKSLL